MCVGPFSSSSIRISGVSETSAQDGRCEQTSHAMTASLEVLRQSSQHRLLAVAFDVPDGVAKQLSYQAGGKLGMLGYERAELGDPFEWLAVEGASIVHWPSGFGGSIGADAVELFDAEAYRIERRVAPGASGIDGVGGELLAQCERLGRRRDAKRDVHVRRRRCDDLAKHDFANEFAS